MPIAREKQRPVNALRKLVKEALGISRGMGTKQIELFVSFRTREIMKRLSDEEITEWLDNSKLPSWVTSAALRGDDEKEAAAIVQEEVGTTTVSTKHLQSRAADRYFVEQRRRIEALVLDGSQPSKSAIRKIAYREYKLLPKERQLRYIAQVRAGVTRQREYGLYIRPEVVEDRGTDDCVVADLASKTSRRDKLLRKKFR